MEPTTPTPTSAANFEFDEPQNEVFRDLARNMSFVGMIYLVLGAFMALVGIITLATGDIAKGVTPVVQAAFFVPVAIWTRRAAQAANAIADTRGNDIGYLMSAMEELKRVYGLQRALLLGLLVLFALLIVIGFVVGMAGAGQP